MKYYKYMRTMNYAHIYDTSIDEFLTHNPPCKDCLVRSMCMHVGDYIDKSKTKPKLFVKACKDLDNYMRNKKCFKSLFKGVKKK